MLFTHGGMAMRRGIYSLLSATILLTSITGFQTPVQGAKNTAVYEGSYGAQLEKSDTYAQLIYGSLEDRLLYKEGEEGNEEGQYTGLARPVSADELSFTVPTDISTKFTASAADANTKIQKWVSEQYQQLSVGLTAATDAFIKDYPQVYWLNGAAADASISASIEGTSVTVELYQININLKEYYDGLAAYTDEFNQGIVNKTEYINETYNMEEKTAGEKARILHDYVAGRFTYNYRVAQGTPKGTDYIAYTALGGFVDGSAYSSVVCEGYAESFKILSDRFGVENALITGTAKSKSGSENHMWNAVKLENGKWYAADVTWDDQSTKLYNTYLLCGENSKGFYDAFGKEHMASGTFSSYSHSKKFVLPQIEKNGFDIDNNRERTEDYYTSLATQNNSSRAQSAAKPQTTKRAASKVTVTSSVVTVKNTTTQGEKISITKATVGKVKAQKLKGKKAVKPSVKVKYQGTALKKGTDYTVTYKNNKKKGKGTIIIKGKGEYTGKKVIKFTIR